jgi:hypothetical protein
MTTEEAKDLYELEEKQKAHYEATGEWKELNQFINEDAFDKDIETSMDDNS